MIHKHRFMIHLITSTAYLSVFREFAMTKSPA